MIIIPAFQAEDESLILSTRTSRFRPLKKAGKSVKLVLFKSEWARFPQPAPFGDKLALTFAEYTDENCYNSKSGVRKQDEGAVPSISTNNRLN